MTLPFGAWLATARRVAVRERTDAYRRIRRRIEFWDPQDRLDHRAVRQGTDERSVDDRIGVGVVSRRDRARGELLRALLEEHLTATDVRELWN
jgi:hypothetical protein